MNRSASINVFAYGSNMCIERLRARVPSAEPLHTGYIRGHRFVFHKRSDDGSVKADAFHTGNANDRVWGIVYQIDAVEKPVLDRYESLGVGYDLKRIDVIAGDFKLKALLYVARPEMIEIGRLPYSWYHEYVIRGANQHRLPRTYIEFLQAFEASLDPDSDRDLENRCGYDR